ncbi:MAG: aldehyde dehydrogenase family protein, partial [Terriglobales bacterium]
MLTATKAKIKPGKLLLGGEWSDAASGATFDTVNPATGEVLTQIAAGTHADVERAVTAARKAFDDPAGPWQKMTASDRGKVLWRIGDLIDQNIEEIAELETLDNGKPIFESRQIDAPMVAGCFHYFSGWATKLTGETVPVSPAYFTYTLREPLGVVGAITPWNFPMIMVAWKCAPALAAGNTV